MGRRRSTTTSSRSRWSWETWISRETRERASNKEEKYGGRVHQRREHRVYNPQPSSSEQLRLLLYGGVGWLYTVRCRRRRCARRRPAQRYRQVLLRRGRCEGVQREPDREEYGHDPARTPEPRQNRRDTQNIHRPDRSQRSRRRSRDGAGLRPALRSRRRVL